MKRSCLETRDFRQIDYITALRSLLRRQCAGTVPDFKITIQSLNDRRNYFGISNAARAKYFTLFSSRGALVCHESQAGIFFKNIYLEFRKLSTRIRGFFLWRGGSTRKGFGKRCTFVNFVGRTAKTLAQETRSIFFYERELGIVVYVRKCKTFVSPVVERSRIKLMVSSPSIVYRRISDNRAITVETIPPSRVIVAKVNEIGRIGQMK